MHIELGIIDPLRIAAANTIAAGLVATQAATIIRNPAALVKTGCAALVFSVLMQMWHQPVGPSELHLIGATTVYLLFGFAPTFVGFALGLVLQAALFEPQDMLHLGVNTLSLVLPLAAVHYSFGRRLFEARAHERFSLARVARIDAIFYAGVTGMVAFWLGISNDAFMLADWARFALAYLPVVGVEILLTFACVLILAKWRDTHAIACFSELGKLKLA